jgi:hypothetical protein
MFTTADLWDEHETVLSCVIVLIILVTKKSFQEDHNDKVI